MLESSNPLALPLLNALSEQYLGHSLPPAGDLLADAAIDYAALLSSMGLPPAQPNTGATPSPYQATVSFTIVSDALLFQNVPAALPFLNVLSEEYLGQPLPPVADLLAVAAADYGEMLRSLGLG